MSTYHTIILLPKYYKNKIKSKHFASVILDIVHGTKDYMKSCFVLVLWNVIPFIVASRVKLNTLQNGSEESLRQSLKYIL